MARKLNRTSYEHLAEKQRELQARLRDFSNTLWDEARAGSVMARNTTQEAKNELTQLEQIVARIGSINDDADAELDKTRHAVEEIREQQTRIQDVGKVSV